MDREIVLRELSTLCAVISESDGSVPERYVLPWRGTKGDALAVVAPVNRQQVQALIAFAIEHDLRLLPQGERTGLVGASVPRVQDRDNTVIVSMERYRTLLEYRESDRRVVVDAGYTLDDVNGYLKDFGVHIPINVSSNPMIGGAVATNIGGSRVVRFGDARKLLLGVEVVLADAGQSVYSTLDRPRKDNSSPDFSGVFCGSSGAYGIITTAAFETFPLFTSTYTAWIALKPEADISRVLYDIENASGDLLLACEFVSREAAEVIARSEEIKVSLPLESTKCDLIFMEWGTTHPTFSIEEFAESFLATISESGFVEDIAIVPAETTWTLRHFFSEALKKHGILIGNDVSVSRNLVAELRAAVNAAIQAYNPTLHVRDFGHLGDGGLHFNVMVEDEHSIAGWTEEKSEEVRKIVAEEAVKLGGSFSAEHGLGSFNTHLYENLVAESTKTIAAAFKKTCDPHNVLGHAGIVLG
ncbi:MAG TPA: FAD-binding oxidoreductase [Acidimicrobiia bacterium]|nr:FAD-binding oxidoreductase [Acidimicrobiia bacterium]